MSPFVEVALALVQRGGRVLLQRRDPAGPVLPGRWEFPGGKVWAGETPEAALHRELAEEVALEVADLRVLPVLEFAYPDRRVRLHPFQVRAHGFPRTPLAWGWFTREEAARLRLPEGSLPLLAHLEAPEGDVPD